MTAGTAPPAGAWRLALVAPSAEAVLSLRADLIHEIIMHRHVVLCVTPPAPGDQLRALRDLGVQHRTVDLDARGLPLLADWRAISALVQVFRDWQPHVVMGVGMPAMMSAAVAARRARVRRIVSVCNGLPNGGLGLIGTRRLAHAMRASNAAIFHNHDDPRRLDALRILPKRLPVVVVPGAGVNVHHHGIQPLPAPAKGLVFLMIARLERARGVADYALAARLLEERRPGNRFLLAGKPGRGADSVAVAALQATGAPLEYLGAVADVRKVLADCHVFVYPSHAEGMPRVILEALAAGRPVITTDAPGCRETVDDKVSGCLVPAGDAGALADAMETFVRRPELIPPTARAARTKAERRFDVRDVNRAVLDVLGLS
jgi:glycosyltransferase involved in cell wall biosynthesis